LDLEAVLRDLDGCFERTGFRWAVAGAVALHAYGYTRATNDLDVVTEAAARAALVPFLEGRGYETLHASAGYSNHLHTDAARGRVDAIYVDPQTADRLFDGCRTTRFAGVDVRVPRPEHLVAMKVHAMKNDPHRTFRELADIQFLIGLPGVDRAEVRGYFEKAELASRYDEIESWS
jgi:hypothetical protein